MRAKVDEFTRGIKIITDQTTGRFSLQPDGAALPTHVSDKFIAALHDAQAQLPPAEFNTLMRAYADKQAVRRAIWVNPRSEERGQAHMMMGARVRGSGEKTGFRIVCFASHAPTIMEYCDLVDARQKQRLYMMEDGICGTRNWYAQRQRLAGYVAA